jgi:hypothetical protein
MTLKKSISELGMRNGCLVGWFWMMASIERSRQFGESPCYLHSVNSVSWWPSAHVISYIVSYTTCRSTRWCTLVKIYRPTRWCTQVKIYRPTRWCTLVKTYEDPENDILLCRSNDDIDDGKLSVLKFWFRWLFSHIFYNRVRIYVGVTHSFT